MKKFLLFIIKIILIGILILSVYKIFLKLSDYNKDSITYKDIIEEYDPTTVNSHNFQEKYNLLKKQNPDYQFWITAENTSINYPVVQGVDNQYYLTHDFNKNQSSSGCIFIDYRNNLETDKNIVLYGHNMRNKTMFNNIEKYKDEDFFKNNNKITITTEEGQHIYEVFSVYVVSNADEYIQTTFNTPEEYGQYVDLIKAKSMYESEITPSEKDNIITLFTCSYEYKDARTIVHGRLIN